MNQLSKEELEKALENMSPEEKLEFLKNTNEAVESINGAMKDYLKVASKE